MPRHHPGSPSVAPKAYAWLRDRMWRSDDTAAASLVSFIVGAAVFLVGATYLLHFAMTPPGAQNGTFVSQELRSTGDHAMQVLLGTSGYPSTWSASSSSVDGVARLGLLQAGSTSRVDATKFDALAHGSSTGASSSNGYVDYDEAKAALGLSGYEFHLRSSPVISSSTDGYGVIGMSDYRVAYIGAYAGGSPTSAATTESNALDSLPIGYSGSAAPSGDLYQDDSTFLRNNLVPHLGIGVTQTTIANGNGNPKYDFAVVPSTTHAATSAEPSASHALALNNSGLGYTKGREMRAVVGTANFTSVAVTTTMRWSEFVGTSNDSGDYGFAELSPDGGTTWYPISNTASAPNQQSTDTWSLGASRWVARAPLVTATNCAPCLGASSVLVAFHWTADSDSTTAQGWVVDDVSIDATGFEQTFEKPDYDMLVVGSNVGQNALTADQVKSAINDFVNVYGGRLMVLGGEQNTQWLQPLFHVGISSTSSAVATPDTTHPLLSVPNELDWASYTTNSKAWDFSGGADSSLFSAVVATVAGQDILAVSNGGAFGAYGENGSVMLTTYLPYSMSGDQIYRFFANALVYGKYRALYFDLGPTVPTGVPVSTSTRTATIDMTNDGSGVYTEIALTMYVWEGATSASGASSGASSSVPAPPRFTGATPYNANVTLTWLWPTSNGTGTVTSYALYRGTSVGGEALYRTLPATAFTFYDSGGNVTNGVTYYYNLSAVSTLGNSTSSLEISATPSTIPGAPTGLAATTGIGLATLSWNAPSTGGAALTNYTIYRGSSSGAETSFAQIAATCTTFIDANIGGAGLTKYYKVSADNANGVGPLSSEVGGTSATVPTAPVATATANSNNHTAHVSWTAVSDPSGAPVTGYKVYGANSTGTEVQIASVGSTIRDWYDTTATFTNGTIRYYKVAATNDVGDGTQSAEATAAFLGLPSQPTSVVVTKTTATAGALTLTWTAPASLNGGTLQGYVIYRGASSGAESQLAVVGAANVTFDDLTIGSAGTSRYYTIAAYSNVGFGANSSEASGTTAAVPGAPTQSALVPVVGKKMTVSWTAPTSDLTITDYKIYRSTSSGTEVYVGHTNSGVTLTYLDTGLTAGTTYYYKVTAVSAAGEGSYSNERSQTATV